MCKVYPTHFLLSVVKASTTCSVTLGLRKLRISRGASLSTWARGQRMSGTSTPDVPMSVQKSALYQQAVVHTTHLEKIWRGHGDREMQQRHGVKWQPQGHRGGGARTSLEHKGQWGREPQPTREAVEELHSAAQR